MAMSKSVYKNYKTTVNWENIVSRYKEMSLEEMSNVLLGSNPESALKSIIKADTGSAKELLLKLVSLPHYQLH